MFYCYLTIIKRSDEISYTYNVLLVTIAQINRTAPIVEKKSLKDKM